MVWGVGFRVSWIRGTVFRVRGFEVRGFLFGISGFRGPEFSRFGVSGTVIQGSGFGVLRFTIFEV